MTPNDVFLAKLNDKIALLTEQITGLVKIKRNTPCFDAQLFNYQGPLLHGYEPYLLELQGNYQKLTKLVNQPNSDSNLTRIIYLSELIVHQLTALQRELATQTLRKAEKTVEKNQTIHEQYAKNLGYLNRLEAMKYQLQQSVILSQTEKKQQLTIIEERIARCRDFLFHLEQKLERS